MTLGHRFGVFMIRELREILRCVIPVVCVTPNELREIFGSKREQVTEG